MSDGEDWRRRRADQLRLNDPEAPARPAQIADAADDGVLPMLPRGVQRPRGAAAPETTASAAPVAPPIVQQPLRPRQAPSPVVAVEPPARAGGWARWWPYVVAALCIPAAILGWLLADQRKIGPTPVEPRAATAILLPHAAPPAAAPPATAEISCSNPETAPQLSALALQQSGADDAGAGPAASAKSANLTSIRLIDSTGSAVTCRAVLELQLAQGPAGSLERMQIISGPVDYSIELDPLTGAHLYRLLSARAILQRLAATAAEAPPQPASSPAELLPQPLPAPVPRTAATLSRPVPAVLPEPAMPPPAIARRADAPRATEAAPPPVPDLAPPGPAPFDRAPDNAADNGYPDLQPVGYDAEIVSIYRSIARTGDRQADDAAHEGELGFLRRRGQCQTSRCIEAAYQRRIGELREIERIATAGRNSNP